MIDTPSIAQQAEQARLELSIAAESRQRANKPRLLVIGAAALVVIAVIGMLVGLSSRTTAQLELSRRRSELRQLTEDKNELVAFARQIESRGLASDPRMAGKIEMLAQTAGVKLAAGVSDTSQVGNLAGMTQRIYSAQVQPGEDPQAIMNFLALTQTSEGTKWLEISQLNMSPTPPLPGKAGWNATIKFARMERSEGRR